MHKIIAIVGMPGAGKSTASDILLELGWKKIRFGDATMEEIKRRGMEISEESESIVRETLRVELGMDAYAKLNEYRLIEAAKNHNVVIDGLYSWQEYIYLKPKISRLKTIAIYASPKTRYSRLATREVRPLTAEEAKSRDYAELDNLKKAEPIAMADFTILNEGTIEDLRNNLKELIAGFEHDSQKNYLGAIFH